MEARGRPANRPNLDDDRDDGIVGVRQFLAAIQEANPDVVNASLEGHVGQRTIPRLVRQRSPFRPPSG
jgi:hypothetical protein